MNKRLMTALLIPLMLISLSGFGHALWTAEDYFISIKETGYVDAEIVAVFPFYSSWETDYGMTLEETLEHEFFGIEDYGPPIETWIWNAYPGFWVCWAAVIENTGSLPIKLYDLKVEVLEREDPRLLDYWMLGIYGWPKDPEAAIDWLIDNAAPDPEVRAPDRWWRDNSPVMLADYDVPGTEDGRWLHPEDVMLVLFKTWLLEDTPEDLQDMELKIKITISVVQAFPVLD